MQNDEIMSQIATLVTQLKTQQNSQNTALTNALNKSLIPQISNMFTLDNGPRGKKIRNMDSITSMRRRNYQIETAGGDRIDIQEENVWFGEDEYGR